MSDVLTRTERRALLAAIQNLAQIARGAAHGPLEPAVTKAMEVAQKVGKR